MTESDHTAQTHAGKGAGFTQSTAFVIIVGLWFAALFGGGCLLLACPEDPGTSRILSGTNSGPFSLHRVKLALQPSKIR